VYRQVPLGVPNQCIRYHFFRAEFCIPPEPNVNRANEIFLEWRFEDEHAWFDFNDFSEQGRAFGLSPAKHAYASEIHNFLTHNVCNICG
jgi:hypothetical protein